MKGNKLIAGLLVLIGFGSCCNKPSKSKAQESNNAADEISVQEDSLRPIRVMYGPPRPQMIPENRIRPIDPDRQMPADSTKTETAPATEGQQTEK